MSEDEFTTYTIRLKKSLLKKYRETCEGYDRSTVDTARELLQAFAEGRVTITPTEKQKRGKELYHES